MKFSKYPLRICSVNTFSWSSLIRRKTDWSKSKKEIKLVVPRDKKRKKSRAYCSRGLKPGPKFFKFVEMLEENLVSFQPTSFLLKLTPFLSETNSHSNPFFFELDLTLLVYCFIKTATLRIGINRDSPKCLYVMIKIKILLNTFVFLVR